MNSSSTEFCFSCRNKSSQIKPSFPNSTYNWYLFFKSYVCFFSPSFSLHKLEYVEGLSVRFCVRFCVSFCISVCSSLEAIFDVFVCCTFTFIMLQDLGTISATVSIFPLFCVDLWATRSPFWSASSLKLSACPGVQFVAEWESGGGVLFPWWAAWMTGKLPCCYTAVFCWSTLHKYSICLPGKTEHVSSSSLPVCLPAYEALFTTLLSLFPCLLQKCYHPDWNTSMDSVLVFLRFILFFPQESGRKWKCQGGKRWKHCSVTVDPQREASASAIWRSC